MMKETKRQRNYKGDCCKQCGVAVSINSKSGYCKLHCSKKRKWTSSQKLSYSQRQKSSGNTNWKGDSVGNGGVHLWVSRNWGKAKNYLCNCGKQAQDWANLNGKYNRDRTNWEPMCRSCHMKYDYKNKTRMPKK